MSESNNSLSVFDEVTFKLAKRETRSISYGVLSKSTPATNHSTTPNKPDKSIVRALLLFMPLGMTCKAIALWTPAFYETLELAQPSQLQTTIWKLICVDRPGFGFTHDLDTKTSDDRIQACVDDNMAVLQAEHVQFVHVLGGCLGHVYAAATAKQLLLFNKKQKESNKGEEDEKNVEPRLTHPTLQMPLFLVAPWVSSQCPHTKGTARLGKWLGGQDSALVHAGVSILSAFRNLGMASISSIPTTIAKNVHGFSVQEKQAFSLSSDYEILTQLLTSEFEGKDEEGTGFRSDTFVAIDPSWQERVCEDLGRMVREEERKDGEWLRVFVGDEDAMVSGLAVEWLVKNAYGGEGLKVEVEVVEHGTHTGLLVGGGPRRDAKLFKKIIKSVVAGSS